MTSPVEPHELSGLLDGELDAQRAAEIKRAMEDDAQLRAEFDRLRTLDRACSAAASQAAFKPRVALPDISARPVPLAVALGPGLLVLLAARLLPKIMDGLAFGIGVHLLLGAAVIVGLVWLEKRTGGGPIPDVSPRGAARTQKAR